MPLSELANKYFVLHLESLEALMKGLTEAIRVV